MKPLIFKELLENRIYFLGALTLTAILLALGDPLSFRGSSSQSGWIVLAALPAAIMGLAAYSRDMSEETLTFTVSRPVRWWWVYLSKLLAGLIACANVGVASALLYALTAPPEYRPFMSLLSLAGGAADWAAFLALAFAAGFLVTCALPGVAASLALLLGLLIVWLFVQPALLGVHSEFWPSLVLLAALVAASVACAVSPLVLQTWPRFRRWIAIMAVGFAGMFICAVVLSHVRPCPRAGLTSYLSPDRQATAFRAQYDDPDDIVPGLWVTRRRGQAVEIESRVFTRVLAWSPDSRTLYYAIVRNGAAGIRAASSAAGWRPVDVCGALPLGLPKDDRQIHPYQQPIEDPESAWSPSGRRLLVQWEYGEGMTSPVYVMMVLDVTARKAWLLKGDGSRRYWWLDNEHLVTTGGQVVEVSAKLSALTGRQASVQARNR